MEVIEADLEKKPLAEASVLTIRVAKPPCFALFPKEKSSSGTLAVAALRGNFVSKNAIILSV